MITVINKNGTEYTYSGVQYGELTANVLDYHVEQGQLLVDVDFAIAYEVFDEEANVPFSRIPGAIYGGDIVDAAVVTQAELQTRQWKDEETIEKLVITVDGKKYSGGIKSQNDIMFAIQTLADKPASETLSLRTIDGSVTSLDLVKIKNIQVAISDKKEVVANTEGHVYADASGNIIIQ